MTRWPIIIKYVDDDELTFVDSPKTWATGTLIANEEDALCIDSNGLIHQIHWHNDTLDMPYPTEQSVALSYVTDLVRSHFSSLGECCVAKIKARTIRQLLELVSSAS